jgi:putative colanic acid biosynthesis acetyltransferase WcaF
MPSESTSPEPAPRVRLDTFDPKLGLDRGRSRIVEAIWYLARRVFFTTSFPWPSRLKAGLLRAFGARVGRGVVIKPRVAVHFPWKLEIGDHAWLGEEAWILNFEPVSIGSNACISQRVFLCAGNHDFRAADFRYRNAPIRIGAGAWVGAQSFVAPGVEIGNESVVCAGSVVTTSLPEAMVCNGNPCTPKKPRWSPTA